MSAAAIALLILLVILQAFLELIIQLELSGTLTPLYHR